VNTIPEHDRHGGEALQAARHARGRQSTPPREAASGSGRIASVVLPFLEQAKGKLSDRSLRLDFGLRKFDVTTGEARSVYFRVVEACDLRGAQPSRISCR